MSPSDDGGLPPEPPTGDFANVVIHVISNLAAARRPTALPIFLRAAVTPAAPPAGDFPTGSVIRVIGSSTSSLTASPILFRPEAQPDVAPADFPTGPVIHVIGSSTSSLTASPIMFRPEPQLELAPAVRNPVLVVKALAQQPQAPAIFRRSAPVPAPAGDFPLSPVHVVTGYATRVLGQPIILRPAPDLGTPVTPPSTGVPGYALGTAGGPLALAGAQTAVLARAGAQAVQAAVGGSARGARSRAGSSTGPRGAGR